MTMDFSGNYVPYHVELNNMIDSYQGNGVMIGLEITAQSTPSMYLDVSIGQCCINNQVYEETSVTTVYIWPAHATHPRIDLICYDSRISAVIMVKGDAASVPIPPDISPNTILLALVSVPANDTTIESSQITDERIFINPVGLYSVGSINLKKSDDTEEFESSIVYVKQKELAPVPGDLFYDSIIRVSFDIKSTAGLVTCYGRVYRNGVAAGIERIVSTSSYTTYAQNVHGWKAGDLIQLYTKGSTDEEAIYVRNFRAYGDYELKSVFNW